ncbi:ABC transporter permease [Halioxenophilus sp. WMMB6]|uniref:ABC transporter permease n=1 Tax=Halioxenophilus sp. WMMB6 TaxID=3073815 RepID=UPI00295E4C1D|nr:ABC transporter permease [Halioxenophilus sp. WMMB6]
MQRILSLLIARNKEYYRDRASLMWSFVMPPLIIAIVALAFSRGDEAVFKVGVVTPDPALLEQVESFDAIQIIHYDELAPAITKVQYHQVDLLINDNHYWINASSSKGKLLEQLLALKQSDQWQAQSIEGREVRYVDWAIPGIISMNLMFSSLFGVGYVIVRYRKNGVLKRLQASPVRPIEFLTAQVLSRFIINIGVCTLVFITADLVLDFVMLGSYLTLLLVAGLGILSLLSLGLIIASRLASEELANGLLNVFVFPMMLMSEVWFPLDGAPRWMVYFSDFLPLTHMVQAARAVMLDGATLMQVSNHLLILAGMTALFLLVSAALFRWRES